MAPDQSSLVEDRVEWFENMEHTIGHFTSELDMLESELRHRDEQSAGMAVTELGWLLYHLKGWRESGEVMIELVGKCEELTVSLYREDNSTATSEYYARRAEHYQQQADYLRGLADG